MLYLQWEAKHQRLDTINKVLYLLADIAIIWASEKARKGTGERFSLFVFNVNSISKDPIYQLMLFFFSFLGKYSHIAHKQCFGGQVMPIYCMFSICGRNHMCSHIFVRKCPLCDAEVTDYLTDSSAESHRWCDWIVFGNDSTLRNCQAQRKRHLVLKYCGMEPQ